MLVRPLVHERVGDGLVTPRGRWRGSSLASHVEVDIVVAELVAVGHVCLQVVDFEVGIVDCGSNAGKSKDESSLHSEICG